MANAGPPAWHTARPREHLASPIGKVHSGYSSAANPSHKNHLQGLQTIRYVLGSSNSHCRPYTWRRHITTHHMEEIATPGFPLWILFPDSSFDLSHPYPPAKCCAHFPEGCKTNTCQQIDTASGSPKNDLVSPSWQIHEFMGLLAKRGCL